MAKRKGDWIDLDGHAATPENVFLTYACWELKALVEVRPGSPEFSLRISSQLLEQRHLHHHHPEDSLQQHHR